MASKIFPRSKSEPARTSNARPTLSLGNQETNPKMGFKPAGPLVLPTNATNRIPTFFIWSLFNLLLLPFGLLCCYFSHKVSHFKRQNRHQLAKKWSERTFVLNIISTLLMAGIIITIVMLHYDYQQRYNIDHEINQTRTTGAYIPWQPGR